MTKAGAIEQTTQKKVKQYEELTFSDDFLFCKILQTNPQLCKEVTELILGKKIGGIVRIDRQEPVEITADGKGVRFDVYMEDDQHTAYDIEMQKGRLKAVPKRSRYYQGMIDLNALERGGQYLDLKPSYVIFICLENPFPDVGFHKYTFQNLCVEKPDLELGDGTVKVLLSAEGTADDITEEMKGFLEFLVSQQASTDLTRQLKEEVRKARIHKRWRVEYMTLLERDEMMREEGRVEERRVHLVSVVCKKLRKGKTPEMIAEELEEELSDIQEICRIAEAYAPEYEEKMVLKKMTKNFA